ncbi:MAG: sugar phosphate isomerase/epimerase family protein, partial [Planctomycetia bacterium]
MRWQKVGVRLESFGLPVKEGLVVAARLGVEGVQFDAVGELAPGELSQTGRRHLLRLATTVGLKVAALNLPFRRGFDVLDRLDQRVAATKAALQLA